ncbi:cytochrome P450 [Streptomyces marianii]|nr:cytochrome P450 [Streptomyces marianii]
MPSGDVARLVVRYDDVRQVLSDPRFTRELHGGDAPRFLPGVDFTTTEPDLLINVDGSRHQRLRRIAARAFSQAHVEGWKPRVEQIVDELIDQLIDHGPKADFVQQFAMPLSASVMCELLGVPKDGHERLNTGARALFTVARNEAETSLVRSQIEAYTQYVEEIIEVARDTSGTSLVHDLIAARDGADSLTKPELVNMVLMLITGGLATTSNIMTRAVVTLLGLPGLYRSMATAPREGVEAVVEELLRRHSVALSTVRVAKEEVELASGAVHAGEAVLASVEAANHDPTVFTRPAVCDPSRYVDRTAERHLAFGHGPHFCLGANLARLEFRLSLVALARRLPGLRLDVNPEDITWGVFMRSPETLPVRW